MRFTAERLPKQRTRYEVLVISDKESDNNLFTTQDCNVISMSKENFQSKIAHLFLNNKSVSFDTIFINDATGTFERIAEICAKANTVILEVSDDVLVRDVMDLLVLFEDSSTLKAAQIKNKKVGQLDANNSGGSAGRGQGVLHQMWQLR